MGKAPKSEPVAVAPKQCTHQEPNQIAEIAKDFVTHTAKAVGAVIVVHALSTAVTRLVDNLTKNTDSE